MRQGCLPVVRVYIDKSDGGGRIPRFLRGVIVDEIVISQLRLTSCLVQKECQTPNVQSVVYAWSIYVQRDKVGIGHDLQHGKVAEKGTPNCMGKASRGAA